MMNAAERGFTREQYAQAFQELVNPGWLEAYAGVYCVTDKGNRIHEETEALTDKYFFAPWSRLNESELGAGHTNHLNHNYRKVFLVLCPQEQELQRK